MTGCATRSTRLSEFVPEPVLSIRDLTVEFKTEDGVVHAVEDVTYDIAAGETLGIVGESGSGKSVSMLAVLGLIPQPPGRIVRGEAFYKGRDLLQMPKGELRRIRGGEVAMVFQDPMTSLNPVLKVGEQLSEAIQAHNDDVSDKESRERAVAAARACRRPESGTALRPVPARVLGRNAPARDDRDGDSQLAVPPDRR